MLGLPRVDQAADGSLERATANRTWSVAKTSFGGTKTAGIFSLAFKDQKLGIAVGGDYQIPKATAHTLALTRDGGKTWTPATGLAFRSGVAPLERKTFIAVGTTGSEVSRDGGHSWQHFSDINLNAVATSGEAVWAVGPKGMIVSLTTGSKATDQ